MKHRTLARLARYRPSPPQWGTARGAQVALIRELGATPVDYQREDFTRVLPGGFDVVCDGIGEEGYRHPFAALNGPPSMRSPSRRLEAGSLEGKLVLCPDLPSRRDRVPPQRELGLSWPLATVVAKRTQQLHGVWD